MTSNLKLALQNPSLVLPYIKKDFQIFFLLLKSGQIMQLFQFVTAELIGRKKYLQKNPSGILVKKKVLGNNMILDICSAGISTNLFIHGIREEKAVSSFMNELEKLMKIESEIIVIELGANIGYFALIEAKTLREKGKIFAYEPSISNFELLEENVKLNNFLNLFKLEQCAIGDESGDAILQSPDERNTLSYNRSNAYRTYSLNDDFVKNESSQEIKMKTIDIILAENNLNPHQINVLRMDVEGYEEKILPTFSKIFASNQNMIIYIELHPFTVSKESMENIISIFEKNNFKIISASASQVVVSDVSQKENKIHDKIHGIDINLSNFDDLRNYLLKVYKFNIGAGIELVLSRYNSNF